jgi:O-antigen ligase
MGARTAVAFEHEAAAEPEASRVERALERATQFFLVLFVLGAPHSIAVAQGSFLVGAVLWIARMAVARRLIFARTFVDVPLLVFVGWTVLSVATSLDPGYSVDKLRGVAFFFILYFFASNVPSRRFAWVLTLLLALSTCGNLAWTYYERARGIGLEVTAMSASPLRKWGIRTGDTIVEIDGRPVRDVAALDAAFDAGDPLEPIAIRFTRGENDMTTEYRRGRVRRDGAGSERLGAEFEPGRSFRSRAFFSHPATYAETLQLAGSVAIAWVIAAAACRRWRWAFGMGAVGLAIAGALAQTQTRGPIAAFALALVAMTLLRGASRRAAVVAAVAALVLVVAAGAFVLQGRAVSMLSPRDDSTAWRLTVWQEAIPLIRENPVFGIGPDAVKTKADELGMFDHGKLPPGHFHSTPIQYAVDRGLPALAAWVALVAAFLWGGARLVRRHAPRDDWRVTAAVLGAWGAFLGFVVSSLVHFNWGDSEPMIMTWALMGIASAVARLDREEGIGA